MVQATAVYPYLTCGEVFLSLGVSRTERAIDFELVGVETERARYTEQDVLKDHTEFGYRKMTWFNCL